MKKKPKQLKGLNLEDNKKVEEKKGKEEDDEEEEEEEIKIDPDRDYRPEYKLDLSPNNKNKTKLIIDEVYSLIIIKERKRHRGYNIIRIRRRRSTIRNSSTKKLHCKTISNRQTKHNR